MLSFASRSVLPRSTIVLLGMSLPSADVSSAQLTQTVIIKARCGSPLRSVSSLVFGVS
jgi:hypothetical protein